MITIIAIFFLVIGLILLVYSVKFQGGDSRSLRGPQFVSVDPLNENSTKIGKLYVFYTGNSMIAGPVLNEDGSSKPIGTAGYDFYEFVVSNKAFVRSDMQSEEQFASGKLVKAGFSSAYYLSKEWGLNEFVLNGKKYTIEIHKEDDDAGKLFDNKSEQRIVPIRVSIEEL